MNSSFDYIKFVALIPKLLSNEGYRNEVEDLLDAEGNEVLSRIQHGEKVSDEEIQSICDAAYEAFRNKADGVLSLGWDGNFPGMSGAAWISELEGVYLVSSSDYDDQGPFESLDESLGCDCFNTVTSSPELSGALPLSDMLDIAKGVVDWENEGEIWINDAQYVVQGNNLVLVES